MTTRDNQPLLVVVAHPRKTRYSRQMSQPVPAEEESREAIDSDEDTGDDGVQVRAATG